MAKGTKPSQTHKKPALPPFLLPPQSFSRCALFFSSFFLPLFLHLLAHAAIPRPCPPSSTLPFSRHKHQPPLGPLSLSSKGVKCFSLHLACNRPLNDKSNQHPRRKAASSDFLLPFPFFISSQLLPAGSHFSFKPMQPEVSYIYLLLENALHSLEVKSKRNYGIKKGEAKQA